MQISMVTFLTIYSIEIGQLQGLCSTCARTRIGKLFGSFPNNLKTIRSVRLCNTRRKIEFSDGEKVKP